MTRTTSRRGRTFCTFVLGVSLLVNTPAWAQKAILADGRVLEGRFVTISGIAVNPLANGGAKHILMCDDDLRRTMVGLREVKNFDQAHLRRIERFVLKDQRVLGSGTPLAAMGTIIRVGDWDRFGRRTFVMVIGGKQYAVIQDLTEIAPMWSKVESLQGGANLLWDMRIATSSIPREKLKEILSKQIKPKDPDERLKLVRFYMQAERFSDAEAELQEVIKDFKELPNLLGLRQLAQDLQKLSAERRLSEVETRRRAGQYRLADRMLRQFPTANVPGAMLEEVRDKIETNAKIQERRERTIAQLDEQLGKVRDNAAKQQIKLIRDEIAEERLVATLDRLAPFAHLADDPDLLAEQKLALAISGWLLGPNDAIDNLPMALSLAETRNIVRAYLSEPLKPKRDQLIESLGSQQGASPKFVGELLDHMKPPVVTPDQGTPGLYKTVTRGMVTYFVLLPPEYVKYPTIVTLNAEGTSPELQIDWWAGVSAEGAKKAAAAGGGIIDPNMRMGQATRHGYIVIAPA